MKPIKERFWEKVDKSSDCWRWTAYKNADGYGKFRVDGVSMSSHRFVYELEVGEIPSDLSVMHKCDNRGCVNPSHLRLGTHQENIADMMEKGRNFVPSGHKHHNAKLNEESVLWMRSLAHLGCAKLGRLFGVTRANASDILNRKIWRHI